MRRFTINLRSCIKRVMRRDDSQSSDVWSREETRSFNILRGTVRLTPREKVRLRKYKDKLRLIANRRLSISSRRREIQQHGGGFLPALLASLATTVFLPLLRQLFA